jgi:hypothetical protein
MRMPASQRGAGILNLRISVLDTGGLFWGLGSGGWAVRSGSVAEFMRLLDEHKNQMSGKTSVDWGQLHSDAGEHEKTSEAESPCLSR